MWLIQDMPDGKWIVFQLPEGLPCQKIATYDNRREAILLVHFLNGGELPANVFDQLIPT